MYRLHKICITIHNYWENSQNTDRNLKHQKSIYDLLSILLYTKNKKGLNTSFLSSGCDKLYLHSIWFLPSQIVHHICKLETSVPSKGSGTICVHTTFRRPHLCDYTGYVVVFMQAGTTIHLSLCIELIPSLFPNARTSTMFLGILPIP